MHTSMHCLSRGLQLADEVDAQNVLTFDGYLSPAYQAMF